MKKRTKWLIAVTVLLLLLLAFFWLSPDREPQTDYLTESARRGDIRQTVAATGEISAAQLVDVGAQASGQIKVMHVKIGQQVKQGDLIAEIDATSQANALNTHRAKLDTYRAQLASAQIALQTAGRQLNREQALMAENATSRQELENAQDTHAAAKARVAELQSLIRQTRIAINTAEADLGYTRITAPISGTVVSVRVEEGQTVNANQTAPTIVQIADLGRMLNKMQIAEGDVTKVQAGQRLLFTTLADPEHEREAQLESVDPGLTTMSQGGYTASTDTTNSAIYYYARALVPNTDGKLAIGMTTQNNIVINEAQNVLSVPAMAVKQRGSERFVRILTAERRPEERRVSVGISDGVRTEITAGLKEGEEVIVSESDGSIKEWKGGPMM
ncbi:MAG: efflux RND transporter periplasmic adaptor subunit [Eikenella sp.]|nr:efflux RND transporter periplasmic adaptor subunit [Eikenella sp.]